MSRAKAQDWKPLDIEKEWAQRSAAAVSNEDIAAVLCVFPCLPSQEETLAARIRDVVDILYAMIHARSRPTPGEQAAALAPLLDVAEQLRDGLGALDAESQRALSRAAAAINDRPRTDFPPLPGLDIGALKISEIAIRLDQFCSYLKAASDQEPGPAGRTALDDERSALNDLLQIWRTHQRPGAPLKPTRAEFKTIVEAVIQPVRRHFKQSGNLTGLMNRQLADTKRRK